MNLKLKNIVLFVSILGTISCKKYLNVVPDNIATINSSFTNANETKAYLFGCYSNLQNLSDIRRNPGFTSSGEILFPINLTDQTRLGGNGGDVGFNLMRGLQNSQSPLINYWDGENLGLNLWQSIRMCNTFLDNVNTPLDLTEMDKKIWIAEAKFLKAYYHYWLIRMYGPIPIADIAIPINATADVVRQKQQSIDSCFNYVVNLLDEAALDLPPNIQNVAADAGRITSTIALSVKAEVLATAASPLFNGNPDYVSFKGKNGEILFPPTYDPNKWKKAADACKIAIDASQANGYSLYEFAPRVAITHMSDSTKQLLSICGAVVDSWNTEQIWTLNPYFSWQFMASPRVTQDAASNLFAVLSNFSVPMSETEIFYTNNGVPINEDKTWDYKGRNTTAIADANHKYYVKTGYVVNKGSLNRERRYYADVAFDGSVWFGSGGLDDNNPNVINAVNGPASPNDQLRYNATGYWAKKLVSYQTAFGQTSVVQNYSWPFLRLPSLWLLYAESLNELNGPSTEAYEWIDKVRNRAGLPPVLTSWTQYSTNPSKPTTKEGLRQIIHQERRIELSFEGQAGWDLRRWKELQSVLINPFLGWNVFNRTSSGYYNIQTVYQPQFGLKDYLFPIKTYDLIINPNLVQTPYW